MTKSVQKRWLSLWLAATVAFTTVFSSVSIGVAAAPRDAEESSTYSVGISGAYTMDITAKKGGTPLAENGMVEDGDTLTLTAAVESTVGNSGPEYAVAWTSNGSANFAEDTALVTEVTVSNSTTSQISETLTCTLTDVNNPNDVLATATFPIQVDPKASDGTVYASGVTLGASSLTLVEGKETSLTASVTPSNTTVAGTWTSSDSAVASVTNPNTKGSSVTTIKALKAGQTDITFTIAKDANNSITQTVRLTVNATTIENVTITSPTGPVTLNPQGTQQFTAAVSPSTASQTVTWSSSDPAVASIDSAGLLSAHQAGSTNVTAAVGSVTSTPIVVTVSEQIVYAKAVTFDRSELLLTVGSKQIVKPILDPADTTVRGSFSISPADVATVHSESGEVTALKTGNATLTYTIASGKDTTISATLPVRVLGVGVTGISLSPIEKTLTAGDATTLTAAVFPANATDKTLVWTSDDTTVATVQNGVVTAVGAGVARITATSLTNPDISATCTLTVNVVVNGVLKMVNGEAAHYKRITFTQGSQSVGVDTKYDGSFSATLGAGTYTVTSNPYTEGNGYLSTDKTVSVGSKDIRWDLAYPKATSGSLTIKVQDSSGAPIAGAQVSVYSYWPTYYNYYNYTDGNGIMQANNIPLDAVNESGISINCWTNDGSISQSVILSQKNPSQTVTLVLPAVTTITGRLVFGGQGVPNQYVLVDNSWAVYSGPDGSFSVRSSGLDTGNHTISLPEWNTYLLPDGPHTFNVSEIGKTIDLGDLQVTSGATVQGRVLLDGRTDNYEKAYVYLYDDITGVHLASGYAMGTSGFGFDGVIKKPGRYRLELSFIYDINGWYVSNFESTSTVFEMSDLNSPVIIKDVVAKTKQDTSAIFTGPGNALTTDKQLVQQGENFSLTAKYRNNGTQTVTATFKTTATGARTQKGVAGFIPTTKIVTLAPGENGRLDIPYTAEEESTGVTVKTTVTIDGREYAFGMVGLEVVGVTLSTASTSVKTGDKFAVYGQANENSKVTIYDFTDKNRILSVIQMNEKTGRWYSADIKLDTVGDHVIYAEVMKDDKVSVSDPITISVSNDPIIIQKVRVDQLSYDDLPFNHRINMRTFSHSVYGDLSPWPLTVRTTFAPNEKLSSVVYHFAGKDFTATKDSSGRWYSNLNGWRGTGIMQLTATVKTTDGKTIQFTVAEVTVLVDPSGYITDADTGRALPGAMVECFVQESDSGWSHWDNEPHGQPANPWMTGENGYYGWNVPTGTYKVVSNRDGYETIDSGAIDKYADGIVIPPPALDVDLAMIPTTPMALENATAKDGKIVLTFSRSVKSANIQIYQGENVIAHTSTVDKNEVVIASDAFQNHLDYRVEVANVAPANGTKAEYFLADVSRTVTMSGVSGGSSGGDSSSSGSSGSSGSSSSSSAWGGYALPSISGMKISPSDIQKAKRIDNSAIIQITGANPKTTGKSFAKALSALKDGETLTLRQIVKRAVTYQFVIDPKTLTTLPENLHFGVSTVNKPVKNQFNKYFSNEVSIVTLAQKGPFGFTAELSVKADLTGMKPANLKAYSYDIATNSYSQITDGNLWVDANGFVHLNVKKGGIIVLSDGLLTLKK